MRPLLAIPGIHTGPRALDWTETLESEAAKLSPPLDVRPRAYGWVAGIATSWSWYRDRIVAGEIAYYKKFLADGPPPNLIAHSFGGYIAWRLMALEGLRFHNVILLAPAAPENTPWRDFDGNFFRLRIYFHRDDEILALSPYGKTGKTGPRLPHPRVEAIDCTGDPTFTWPAHNHHTRRERMAEYLNFLAQDD